MKLNIKTLINYLAIFIIFSGAITYRDFSFAELRFFYVIMAIVFLSWLPFLRRVYFNKTFLLLFSLTILFSFYNIFIGSDSIGLLTKQAIGIFATSLFFYLLIKINNCDLKGLFKIYLNIAFLVGLLGVVQEVSFLLRFKPGYYYGYHYFLLPYWRVYATDKANFLRVNSILTEPAQFCSTMVPAFFVALVSFTKNNFRFLSRWKSFIIIISFVLSMSSLGYVGIIFCIILLFCNYNKIKYILFSGLISLILILFFYSNVPPFKSRVDDSLAILTNKILPEQTNLSTFTLFSNALVAFESFKNNPLFGSGLGSHEISNRKYITKFLTGKSTYIFANVKDAASLFSRLLSETGLFGLLVFFIFIFKFYIRRKDDTSNYLWIINNAILSLFFVRLIRNGHYFNEGFFFFIWMYYFSKIKLRDFKNNQSCLNGQQT